MQQLSLSSVLSVIGMLLMMVLVFAGAYLASRILGKSMQMQKTVGGQIEVLDRTILDKDKSLLVVRVAGKVYLLGAAAQSITNLAELAEEALQPQQPSNADFLSTLKEVMKRQNKGDMR